MILQNVALFSQRATWIRHKHTYVMFLLNLLSPSWFHPSAVAKSLQSCPTLCDPIDGSPPGSVVPGILQARTLEWVAVFFSSAWKWKVKVKALSHVRLSAIPWTAAHQAPPSMGFSRREYWSGVPLPSRIYVHTYVYIIYVYSKESACDAGDLGWIPGLGRPPGERNGYPFQHSCL